jgi:NitT/TauT family transport system substrate-binding protein
MPHSTPSRLTSWALGSLALFALVLSACSSGSSGTSTSSGSTTKVTAILGWYAEPARAGFYTAQDLGYYRSKGIDANLLAGADVSPEQVVGSGRAAFGLDDADAILQADAQGIPLVALMATYQNTGFIIVYHQGQPIHGFQSLGNRTAYIFPGALWWQYIEKKYHLAGIHQVSYSGALQPFIADPSAINQGYIGSEDVTLADKGIKASYLRVASSGYDPYSNVLFTTKAYLQAHPQVVKNFVQATVRGLASYKTDYKTVDKYMNQFNKGFPASAMDQNAVQQASYVYGGDAATHGIGYMTAQRWTQVANDLRYIGVLKKPVDISTVYTDKYLPSQG